MKNKFVVLLVLLLAACSNNPSQTDAKTDTVTASGESQSSTYVSLPPAQIMELIQNKKDLLIIDVRSPQELREGKIVDSTLIPFWDIMKGNYSIPKDRPILMICAVGGRSYAAMQILSQKGYKEIYNLQGGIDAWKKANLPVVY
ncbi:MAG: rhodanese-like domain-containing protein [Proteobacteria bacterium]|nr:rhodanese-like domain-containing protein [Desulfobulbaceae bacterium]MBU4151462.1 rhodanese-like domain-containing protein [Pseudomonadota bacterium]MDP2105390.1 rhodanese-like domain-containing protein [Desulfobulbaceae bacterium]